jgi:signal transduction histidine kinase
LNPISKAQAEFPSHSGFGALLPLGGHEIDGLAHASELHALVRGLRRQLNLQRTELDEALAKIGKTQMKLRQVSADLMTAQEVERRRISQDLQEGLGQALQALGFTIGGAMDSNKLLDHESAGELLLSLSKQVKLALEHVRRIGSELRPSILDDLGIVGTLTWFLREFAAAHPTVQLVSSIELAEANVPPTLRTPIYRTVQEVLSNAVKYCGATRIELNLACSERGLALVLIDNGRGFNLDVEDPYVSSGGAGFGLTGIGDRVEFSGGECFVISAPGQGTKIRCNWDILGAGQSSSGFL